MPTHLRATSPFSGRIGYDWLYPRLSRIELWLLAGFFLVLWMMMSDPAGEQARQKANAVIVGRATTISPNLAKSFKTLKGQPAIVVHNEPVSAPKMAR